MKPSPLCLLLVALFATSLVNALIKPIKPVIDSNRVTLTAGSGLAVNVDTATGLYNVQVDGSTWFNGPLVAFHLNSKWYSSADKSLVLQSSSMNKGTTNFLGAYTSISVNWLADSVPITTTFKSYTGIEAIVFEVNFPQGAKNTALGINNDVITAFPHFANISDSLNYLTYSSMFGAPHVDKLNIKNAPGGIEGGPIFAYNSDLRTVAISSLDNFMVAIHEWSASLNQDLSFGINGKVLEFPENYTVSTILFGGQGVRQTVLDWGAALLGLYGKKPTTLDADDLISNLGYWTDDGGYYWYTTEPNKNYQTTIIDVMNYIRNISLPVKNFQLDSWWYFKGKNQGVYTWTPQPSVFPNGIEYVQDNLKIPFAMHNRYFSPDTPYQHNYSMVVEDYCALPQDERLFHDIMALSKSWGNVLYEQDWLITTYEKMNVTQNNVTAARYWLTSMGAAASSLNMTIQYCMPLVLHLLQSVEVQAVTQARATGDYVPGTTQWLVGYPSMLLWALGLVPFRDDFWSTEIQPNCYNMDGHGTYCNEPNTHLMALTAALTAGPVGPSDSIGKINRDLVMRTAREDGKLLKADFPAMPLDVLFSSTFASPSGAANTQLWQSSTSISGYTYHYVFSSQLQQPFVLQATDLPAVSSSDKFVAFDYYAIYNNVSQSAVAFDATNPLVIPNLGGPGLPNATVQFRYYVVSPITTPCVILGEFSKFITVSQQRVKSISVTSTEVSVSLIGAPGETVSFWFLKGLSGTLSYVVSSVTLDSDGLGSVSCQ